MNLLGKKKSLGALALGLFLFISCEENGPFGLTSEDVVPVDFTSVEIPVPSSVVWLDSIQSSSTGVFLIGEYTSNTFGKMTATMYSRLNLNRAQVSLVPSESTYDSVKFNAQFIYAFDTSAMARDWGFDGFGVERGITDTLHITSDRTRVSANLLTEGNMTISDFDSIYSFDFDDAFGSEFHELIKDDNERVSDQENFVGFFRGISFSRKPAFNQNIYGLLINENTNVTVHYRDPGIDGEINVQRTYTMDFRNVAGYYNLTIDRTGTPLEFLQQTNVEYQPATGKRYVQSGAGIVTKLDLSGFRDLIIDDPRIINLAEISIGPIDELDDMAPPPTQLVLAFTDDRNTVIRDIVNNPPLPFRTIQSDGNSALGSGNPVTLNYNADTRTYTGSVTTYFQTYFAGVFQRDEVFLYPSNMNTSVNGISFDAEDIKLNIIFSELQ